MARDAAAKAEPEATAVEGTAPWHGEAAGPPAPEACVWLRAPKGPGGAPRLRAALWRAPGPGPARGLALLFPGRTEYLEKYAPVVARLRARNFDVASLDWRGQGLSDRAVPRLGHIGRFAEFQADARALLAWAPVAAHDGPRVLLGHSMGGCIGLRALVDGALSAQDARPAAAIFSAPMWGLRLGGTARFARPLVHLAALLGWAKRAARPGDADSTYVLDAAFEGNVLTTDRRFWDRFVAQARAHPELTLASPTFGWVDAAFAETAALARASGPDVPRLALLGTDEGVVDPAAIRTHAERGGPQVVLAEIHGGRHETLMEDPDGHVGAPTWQAIDDFLHAQGL